jgi:hypothetical protein
VRPGNDQKNQTSDDSENDMNAENSEKAEDEQDTPLDWLIVVAAAVICFLIVASMILLPT